MVQVWELNVRVGSGAGYGVAHVHRRGRWLGPWKYNSIAGRDTAARRARGRHKVPVGDVKRLGRRLRRGRGGGMVRAIACLMVTARVVRRRAARDKRARLIYIRHWSRCTIRSAVAAAAQRRGGRTRWRRADPWLVALESLCVAVSAAAHGGRGAGGHGTPLLFLNLKATLHSRPALTQRLQLGVRRSHLRWSLRQGRLYFGRSVGPSKRSVSKQAYHGAARRSTCTWSGEGIRASSEPGV